MDKLPVCRLCKHEPIKSGVTGLCYCSNNLCEMKKPELTPEQWAALMGQPEPDMFWISDRPEDSFSSVDDLVEDVISFCEIDEVKVTIDLAVSLPKRRIICWGELDNDGEIQAKWKWAEQGNNDD